MQTLWNDFWGALQASLLAAIALLFAFFLPLLGGCDAPNLATRTFKDVGSLLDKPAVQSTLERWAAKADVTNPRMSFVMGTIFETRLDGTIVRGDVAGPASGLARSAGKSGMDAELYERFMEQASLLAGIADRFDQLLPPEPESIENEQPGE